MTQLALERRWAWIYLINLSFYIVPLFFGNYSTLTIIALLAALPPFIAGYFWAYSSTPATMWRPIALMLSIASIATPWHPGTIALFGYAGFFIGFAYEKRTIILSLSAIMAWLAILQWWNDFTGPYFLMYGSVLTLGVTMFGMLERNRQLNQRQKEQSQAEIKQLAQMVERERIARDLHDIMGHSLSSIILKADLAAMLLKAGQTEQAAQHLTELSQVARDSLSQVRQTVSGYKHKGLLAEISTLAQRLREHGFAVSLEGDVPTLAAREESAVILVLTELVTNILRHSKGNSCQIKFSEDNQGFKVEVSDNGEVASFGFGNGLTGIQERLSALQAKLDYQLDHGCHLSIWLPKRTQA